MNREEKKNKFRERIQKKALGTDERGQQIYQRAFRITLQYICGYTFAEIICKIIFGAGIYQTLTDILRLVTTLLVYVFIMLDNKSFSYAGEGSGKMTLLEKLKVLKPSNMDERMKKISGTASAIAFAYHLFFLSVVLLYRIASHHTKHIWIDYILFITILILVGVLCGKNETFGLYRNAKGEILDKTSKSAVRERRGQYRKQALQTTVWVAVFELITDNVLLKKTLIEHLKKGIQIGWLYEIGRFAVIFMLEFLVVWLCYYLIGEHAVKKYNRKLRDMDD